MEVSLSFNGSLNKKKIPLFVPYNSKIADITHADTANHELVLANEAGNGAIAGETRKIIAVAISATRVTGTGYFRTRPNEGTALALELGAYSSYGRGYMAIADGSQRLRYYLSVSGDDFDVYCYGYVVEA